VLCTAIFMTDGRDPNARQRAVDAALAKIDAAVEDAKQGDFSGIDAVVGFVSGDQWEVADAASEALEKLGPRRALDALANKARVRIEPIYALASIGTPAVVPHLIALLGDEELEFREHARRALHTVLGDRLRTLLNFDEISAQPPGDEQTKVAAWWAAHAAEFDPNAVHYHGEPFDVGRDVETMVTLSAIGREQELAAVEAIAEKVTDFTGHHIENASGQELARRWQEWWRENSSRFKRGRRYFYGHLVD
jgi:HEAT repeat protein